MSFTLETLEERAVLSAFAEFIDPNPAAGNQFGARVVPLSTGNVVVTAPFDDAGGTNAGAVYLFNGATGALISTLIGSHANDNIGSDGIIQLGNGNYLVVSHSWDNGGATNAGAVTWGSGTTGVAGVVGAANSLIGSSANDTIGAYGIRVLGNGNYVVISSDWDNSGVTNAGAVTWGSGTTGVKGEISAANSLIGSTANDRVGYAGLNALTVLANGNYVVRSAQWDNSGVVNAGAVTWGSGTTGVVGVVSASNSLVGSTESDNVGLTSVTALSNGNYVVRSPNWDNGIAIDAGAVTWGSGTSGVAGAISAANSLVGSSDYDSLGATNLTLVSNGNYLVRSYEWDNGAATDAGSVTWGSGTAGVAGVVTAANSLVGSTTNDWVGSGFIKVLSNGNYVVSSPFWNNGAATSAGAVTWGNGATGVTGAVSPTNSLVGGTASDLIGYDSGNPPIQEVGNGNYVVLSSNWDNGGATNAGAVTWANGATGLVGLVNASNSLVGGSSGDNVGFIYGLTVLSNGNYVVGSPSWRNGSVAYAGAATWGSGSTGVVGVVSAANSLVGSSENDQVGASVIPLSNGNYLVRSYTWANGAIPNAGAVTWGSGTGGVTGAVSAANSLVGGSANDQVGSSFVTELANGNYVVKSPNWDNAGVANAGAATWGNGATGTSGVVSAANSLVGSTANDNVGNGAVTTLVNGNYVVTSSNWDNGAATNAGAVTWGSGTAGVAGAINSANSLVGSTTNDNLGKENPGSFGVTALSNGNYVVSSAEWDNGAATNAGAVTWGSGTSGVAGTISSANSLVGSTTNDLVGFSRVAALSNGNYVVSSYNWDNGAASNAGAVTWGSGAAGVTGTISAANSLVGSTTGDNVGFYGGDTPLPLLSNGNYVVRTFNWDNGAAANAGATTWGSATSGVVGVISASNSIVGLSSNTSMSLMVVDPVNGTFYVPFINEGGGRVRVGSQIGPNTAPTDLTISNDAVDENAANGTVVGAFTATDPDPIEAFTYSLLDDAGGRFAISGANLTVANGNLLDYEASPSHGIIVRVTDSENNTFDKPFTISLNDLVDSANDPPEFTSGDAFSVAENTAAVTTVAASDPEMDSLAYAIAGGADSGLFSIHPTSGALSFITAPNFEAPADAGANNVYNVTVSVSDGVNPAVTQGIVVTVTDKAEFTFSGGVLSVVGTANDDDINVFNDAGFIKIDDQGVIVNTGLTAASVSAVSISGLSGHDTLKLDTSLGAAVLGTLLGGAGNDLLISGLGNDTLDGGADTDNISYQQALVGVKVSLALTKVQSTLGAGNDKILSAENLIGSSFNDTLTGGSGDNILNGGLGNDTLSGGLGADSLIGGDGNDTLKFDNFDTSVMGGAGTDTATVINAAAAVSLSLTVGQIETVSATSSSFHNTFDASGATWVVTITGGSGNDTIIGGVMADKLTGGDGNDTLIGNEGADTMTGSGGADNFDGGDANDKLFIDNFDTSVVGGAGADTATVKSATAAVSLNLVTSQIETVIASSSTFNNIFDATGATWIVKITGGSGNDTLIGGNLADQLNGGAGNDLLIGGLGNDKLTGGDGNDTVSYATAAAAVNANLATKKTTGGAGTDTLNTIENVTGSEFDDTITGDAFANILDGLGGVDTIVGGGGADTILNP